MEKLSKLIEDEIASCGEFEYSQQELEEMACMVDEAENINIPLKETISGVIKTRRKNQ